jgi:TetR/AcrR family transcriptional repressor of nem operon
MRYASDHKATIHQRLLKEAAREIRAKGPGGVAVAGIMARLGLTHGGFYAHFASKDQLVAEAIGTMFEDGRRNFDRLPGEGDPRGRLAAYIDFYVSDQHRDRRDRGCPLPSLSADLARLEPAARERFGVGVATLTGLLIDLLTACGWPDAEPAAASMLAEMVGAIALSRAVADPVQSDAILANTRAALLARFNLGEFV